MNIKTGKRYNNDSANRGMFITFEGCEGSGKSTQSVMLYNHLLKSGRPSIHTREPGGTGLAESIRAILLNPNNTITPLSELMLYEAARAQHINDLIIPELAVGKIVICDRYTDATFAYQGFGRGLDRSIIKNLNNIATQGITPDLTIYLDIPVEEGLERAKKLSKDSFVSGDRLEREDLSFHHRVRQGYLFLAKKEPGRIKVVRTRETIAETHSEIVKIVENTLKRAKSAETVKKK